jgi:hypothetical protein
MENWEFEQKHGKYKGSKRVCTFCKKEYYGFKKRFCGPICENRYNYFVHGEGKDKRYRRGITTYDPYEEWKK